MANGKPRIAFIGFGEAGQAIAAGLRDADAAQMTAWDILFPRTAGNKLRRAAEASGVHSAVSAADAVRQAELVICAVTGGIERRRGRIGEGASARKPVLPRHQFGVTRPQAGHRQNAGRRRTLH